MNSAPSPADIPASRARPKPIRGLLISKSILICRHSEAPAYERSPPQKRPRDPTQLGKLIVDIATGQAQEPGQQEHGHEATGGRGRGFFGISGSGFHDLPRRRLQLDEISAFCYTKARDVMLAKNAPEGAGDIWTLGCAGCRKRSSCRPGALATAAAQRQSNLCAIYRVG
jgi:hypothetical protein